MCRLWDAPLRPELAPMPQRMTRIFVRQRLQVYDFVERCSKASIRRVISDSISSLLRLTR